MQAIMETGFDILYLSTVIILGVIMIKNAKNAQHRLFGIMAVVLGCGDAFHLIPRAYALCTNGLEANAAALGAGKFITSITMTIFYIILYKIFCMRYDYKKKATDFAIYALAAVRIAICLLPGNNWLSANAPVSYGIYRNLPFAVMGIIILVLFYKYAKKNNDTTFKFLWLAIVLSFGFYVPVVLFADAVPLVGTLMIPKTIAYVWIVFMGFQDMKKTKV